MADVLRAPGATGTRQTGAAAATIWPQNLSHNHWQNCTHSLYLSYDSNLESCDALAICFMSTNQINDHYQALMIIIKLSMRKLAAASLDHPEQYFFSLPK